MASMILQLSCISVVSKNLQLQRRQIPCQIRSSKLCIFMSLDGHGVETSTSESKTTLSYDAKPSLPHIEATAESIPVKEENVTDDTVMNEPVKDHVVQEQQRAAKIHDFCFGIPFGGFVLSGGLLGFIFSRNPTTLFSGVVFGGALLALSTTSLKIWRQGKSSIPFIVGQAALAAALLWKNSQSYVLTKKIFPTGFYAAISAAMLCFYTYVVISGGNPPAKKLKSPPTVTSY